MARLFLGALLARGRGTVTAWIRAAGLSRSYRCCYPTVAAAGRDADLVAARLLSRAVKPLIAAADRISLALDDTPTRRYGPYVQGAGIHHNPAPGPVGAAHLYGHVFVVLGLLAAHPSWGVMALPLLARLYVREADLPAIDPKHRPEFRTKLEMGVELLRWALGLLKSMGKPIWIAADGAYAKAPFLKPVKSLGVTVVSRLRKDAALFSAPPPRRPGQPGRPRIYGAARIDLARRAADRRGWSRGCFELYGEEVVKRYKTFVATWRPAGGAIRVVLVDEPSGPVAFFCTDVEASADDILATMAARFALEIAFRECKQVVGAGSQQVRHVWASVGSFHVCLWTYTMTEARAWGRSEGELVDRTASPWDDPARRPSHADKRRAWRRELLAEEIRGLLRPGVSEAEIAAAAERMLSLAA
jgi:hypothetical protein